MNNITPSNNNNNTVIKFSISQQIENLHFLNKLDYMEAILLWCEKNDMSIEEVASIIRKDPGLKLKLQIESEGLHLLKLSITNTINSCVINALPIS